MNGQVATTGQCGATCRIIGARCCPTGVQTCHRMVLTQQFLARGPQIPEECGGDPFEITSTSARGCRAMWHGVCCEHLSPRHGEWRGTPRTASVRPLHTRWAQHHRCTRVHARGGVRSSIPVNTHSGPAHHLQQWLMCICFAPLNRLITRSHQTSTLPRDRLRHHNMPILSQGAETVLFD